MNTLLDILHLIFLTSWLTVVVSVDAIVFPYFSNIDSLDDPSPSPAADDIPVDAVDALVNIDALYRVLHHGESAKGDSHRFSVSADPEDATSRVNFALLCV